MKQAIKKHLTKLSEEIEVGAQLETVQQAQLEKTRVEMNRLRKQRDTLADFIRGMENPEFWDEPETPL